MRSGIFIRIGMPWLSVPASVICLLSFALPGDALPSPALEIQDATAPRKPHYTSAPAFSPDSACVALTIVDPLKITAENNKSENISTQGSAYGSLGSDIWLYPADGGVARNLTAGAGNSWSPVWSPDGSRLAFYSDRDGQPNVWVWEKETNQFRKLADVTTRNRFANVAPVWTLDGRGLFITLSREGDNPDTVDVGLLDVVTGVVKRLASDVFIASPMSLSTDGSALAWIEAVKGLRPHPQVFGFDGSIASVALASGEVRKVFSGVFGFSSRITWSPDSKWIAYIARDLASEVRTSARDPISISGGETERGILSVVSADGGITRTFGSTAEGSTVECGAVPAWDARSRTLYAIRAGEIWSAALDKGRIRRLTSDPTAEVRSFVWEAGNSRLWTSAAGGALYAAVAYPARGRYGFARVNVSTGQMHSLYEEEKTYLISTGTEPVVLPDGRQLLYLAEGSQEGKDYRIIDTRFTQATAFTLLNPALGRYRFGASRLIKYLGSDGEPLQASVLLPPDHSEGHPHPTVVWVYAGIRGSRYVNRFGLSGMPQFNLQMLATRGYAVLYPDVPVHQGTPMQDLMKSVMPAIDRAVELDITDPERLAVMGQSNGGYSTLALIVQTQRFKAAVVNSGFGDLTAFFGTRGGGWIPFLQENAGAMGGAPWEVPLRYMQNSPIYYLDRITTPLILQAGADDAGIINHSDAVWVGLQHLKKDATYLRYEGEGHLLATPAHLSDYWQQVIAFFDLHLRK